MKGGKPMQTTLPTSSPIQWRWVSGFLLENGLYLSTIALLVAFSITLPSFLTLENGVNILGSAALKGIIAAGFTVALIAGLIDTSIIGVAAVSSVLAGVLVQQLGWPLWAVLLSLTGAAAVMASVNNALVVRAKVNSFVATTATSGVFLGMALALTNGQTLTITRPELQNVLLARPLGVPVAVAVMFAVYIAGYAMLNHTRLGAHLYATGENHNAARVNGVPVNRVVYTALALCALASAFGALFATARAGSTLLFGTQFLAFDLTEIFTAVLLGGASLFGGGGKIERNLVAVLFLSILANGLQLMQAGTGVWLVLKGGSFVAAILIDVIRQRRQ
jgi:ribose/xylose/arabinose/galactoside ABC-type transport system permease subunit